MTTPVTRILAIDPGMQYLGFAGFEREELLWFGVKTFPDEMSPMDDRCRIQQFLAELLQTHAPSVLAISVPEPPRPDWYNIATE